MPEQVGIDREPAGSSDKQDGEIFPKLVLVSILPQSTGPDTTPESSNLSSHWEDTSLKMQSIYYYLGITSGSSERNVLSSSRTNWWGGACEFSWLIGLTWVKGILLKAQRVRGLYDWSR